MSSLTPATQTFCPDMSIGHKFGNLVDAYIKGRKGRSDEVYDRLTQFVTSDKKVLDLGCGTGVAIHKLSERYNEVHGCDIDGRMVEAAKEAVNRPELILQGVADHLAYPDGTFGVIFLSHSFHWFCNKESVLEMSRVLEEGGYVYVIEGGGSSSDYKNIETIIESVIGHTPNANRLDGYTPEKTLAENGFRIVPIPELRPITEIYSIDDALQERQSHSIWNYVKDADKEKEVLAKLREYYSTQVDHDGLIHSERKETVLLAQKILL